MNSIWIILCFYCFYIFSVDGLRMLVFTKANKRIRVCTDIVTLNLTKACFIFIACQTCFSFSDCNILVANMIIPHDRSCSNLRCKTLENWCVTHQDHVSVPTIVQDMVWYTVAWFLLLGEGSFLRRHDVCMKNKSSSGWSILKKQGWKPSSRPLWRFS